MEPTNTSCSFQPNIIFLSLTVIVTLAATAMLCTSILTQNWEYITWDKNKLESIEKNLTNETSNENVYKLEWLLDGQVARVILVLKNSYGKHVLKNEHNVTTENLPALFFAPIRSGIWKFCINLSVEQQQYLIKMGFPKFLCTNYLKVGSTTKGNFHMDWQHRIQNLSISCALVCLIIVGSSTVVGTFGITKRQISAVLVTGVMYLLAAIFATFSLSIIHFKRAKSKTDCLHARTTYGYTVEGVIISLAALEKPYSLNTVNKFFEARIFSPGWSLHLGWGGAAMCVLASTLWITLSKIMRIYLVLF